MSMPTPPKTTNSWPNLGFRLFETKGAFFALVVIPTAATVHHASVSITRTYAVITWTTERRIGFGAILGFVVLYIFAILTNAI